jgi:hypothetical protein
LDMDVQPAEAVGRKAVFRITFLNQLTWPVSIALTAHDTENGLRFRIEPETPVVVPGSGVAGPVTVHAVPRVRRLLGKPHPYEIQFHGLEVGSWRRANQRARFVYVPRYTARRLPVWLRWAPRWAVLLPLVLLVLLLVFAGGRTLARPTARPAATPTPPPPRVVSSVLPTRPRATVQGVTLSRPSIGRFTLVHGHRGQPYELVWQIRGAAHATLDGRAVAARGRLVLQAPLHSATYRLAATNGARRAAASLHLVVDAVTTDRHAFVLRTPDIATFALRRRHGKLYAIWLVRHAVHVRLQGRLVPSAGTGLVPAGASWLRLVASNDVGSRQRLLHLARPVPPATPRPRPTATPTVRPTTTPPRRPTMTATARPSRLLIARPTAAPRPTATPSPRPTETSTARPTATSAPPPTRTRAVRPATTFTPRPTATSTLRPTVISTPRPTKTPTPRPTMTPTPRPTVTPTARPTRTATPIPITIGTIPLTTIVLSTPTAVPTPRPTETPTLVSVTSTPTAVSVTCCFAQP